MVLRIFNKKISPHFSDSQYFLCAFGAKLRFFFLEPPLQKKISRNFSSPFKEISPNISPAKFSLRNYYPAKFPWYINAWMYITYISLYLDMVFSLFFNIHTCGNMCCTYFAHILEIFRLAHICAYCVHFL